MIDTSWEQTNKDHTWKFLRSNFNRPNVIYQDLLDNEINYLYLKQKTCNQGEILVNWMATDDGDIGITFQFINPKKYYALEFNSNYIKVYKNFDDVETILAYKQTQGYVVN